MRKWSELWGLVVGVVGTGVFEFGFAEFELRLLVEGGGEVEVIGEARRHHGGQGEYAGLAEEWFVVREGYGVDVDVGGIGEGGFFCTRGTEGAPAYFIPGQRDRLEPEAVCGEGCFVVGKGDGGAGGCPRPAGVIEADGNGVLSEHFASVVFVGSSDVVVVAEAREGVRVECSFVH